MVGKTLGHYRITSQFGKGGMGEAYQAKDQELGCDEAIKGVQPTNKAKAPQAPQRLSIVLNWFDELMHRVPVK